MALFADDIPIRTSIDIRPDTYIPAAYRIEFPLPFQAQNSGQRLTGQDRVPDLFSKETIRVLLKSEKGRPADAQPSWRTAVFDLRLDEASESLSRLFYLHFMTPNPGGKPPKQIGYTLVVLSEDFFVASDRGEEILTGLVEARGDKFFVDVQGTYGSSAGIFRGEVELEKPFQPTSYVMSGVYYHTRFVLSLSSDCSTFLKASDASGK